MKYVWMAAGMAVFLSVAAYGDNKEEIRAGMADIDRKISGMTCEDLRKEVQRLPEIVEEVSAAPEATPEGALGRYGLGLMLRKIAWCIPGSTRKDVGLRKPDGNSPEEAVLIEWHAAVVSGDFEKYKSLLGPSMKSLAEDQVATMFRDTRALTPKEIVIGEPKVRGNNVEFQAVGCIGIKPVVGSVSITRRDGAYSVLGVWGPSWNPDIHEIHPCF